MNDLETALAESLRARAAAIDSANLAYPDWRSGAMAASAPDPTERPTRRWLMPAVAAVAVALTVATTIALATHAVGPRSRAAGSGGSVSDAGFIGYRWRLVQIQQDGNVTDVPTSLNASIAFAADHSLLMNDTVNVSSGSFTPVRGGYRIGDLAQTLVGYDGRDPVRTTVIDAMAVLGRRGTVTASTSYLPGTPVRTQLRLTRSSSGVSLVFDQDGIASPR